MNDCKIELCNGHCFGQQQLLVNSIENFKFHFKWEKKSDLWLPDIYKALRHFWLLNWVSIARVAAHFPQASRSLPVATASNLVTPCVCACQSNQPKLCWSTAPRAWPLILQSNPSTVFSNSLLEWLPDETTSTGLQGLKLELCAPDQWFVEVLSAQKPPKKVQ